MSQNELILKVSDEGSSSSCNDNHEEAANLNLVSPIIKTKKFNSKSSGPSVQTHSRASSGTSNLSVKFTIDRDETDRSSPSITESVSVCSSPQNCSTYLNYNENAKFSKPPVPPSNQTKSKRRKCRKSVDSSGQDSGIMCTNSVNEVIDNDSQENKNGKCNDECLSMDEVSDADNRLHQVQQNEENSNEENKNQSVLSRSFDQNVKHYLNQSLIGRQSKNDITKSNYISDRDTQSHTQSNFSQTSHKLESNISPSIYQGTISSNARGGHDRSGHKRNDSHQPLLSDDRSFDSSSSEDDAGLNNSGYTRRKTKTGRSNTRDTYSELVDCSGDGRNINFRQKTFGDNKRHPKVIDNDYQLHQTINIANEPHIKGEPLKTLIAFLFLVFAWVATTTSLALTHDRVPYDVDPLPDIFLDNVTYQHWGLDASEIIIMISTWTAFLITIFHKHRFIVLRRVFLLVGLHYYYRSITMFLTVLPVADVSYRENYCMPPSNDTTPAVIAQRVIKLLSGMGLAINGKHVYCGDYIYSGHTMTLIMGYLVIKHYSPRSWFLLHYASLATSIAGVVTLLLARGHYSIDVIIAYWVTTRIWWIFHTLANNANLKEVDGFGENPNNFLKKLWWWYIFRYFECNVPVNLPRKYGLPIPRALTKSRPFNYIKRKLKNEETEEQQQPPTSTNSIENIA